MRIHSFGVALVALVALAGCTSAAPAVTAAPTPSSTPLFASDAEALRAATDAFAAYLKVSSQIGAEGGRDPERIKPFVSTSWYVNELASARSFAKTGNTVEGLSAFDNVSLQQASRLEGTGADVTIYLCSDVSGTRLLDAHGVDVTPADREDRAPFEVEFVTPKDHRAALVLERNTPWTGPGIC
jgi:hypothetical protein